MSTALLAGAMALVACSGSGEDLEPPIEPTDLITPSDDEPTEDPDVDDPATIPPEDLPEPLTDLVSEPVYPEAATEFTPDGAEAFVHYVIEATNWSIAVGDADPLTDYCDASSRYCDNVEADASSANGADSVRYGGVSTIDVSEVVLVDAQRTAFVAATVSRAEYVDVRNDDGASITVEASEFDVAFELEFISDGWKLVGAVSQ